MRLCMTFQYMMQAAMRHSLYSYYDNWLYMNLNNFRRHHPKYHHSHIGRLHHLHNY
ncbi:MAG: hypothetical protein IJ200_08525 [Prevotella sp.]|nr:hypothetical protein [Prevotella sp.]